MKKSYLFLFLFTFSLSPLLAQGVVYSKEQANSIYGPVLVTKEIQSILLSKYFNQTNGKLMFRIYNDYVVILDDQRNQLYPGGASVGLTDKFRVFSTELINEILTNGGNSVTSIELRNNEVISLTNGDQTLEYGGFCPPYCP